ncbi:hypothetical protein MMC31_008152 [Peltigera leucophlebia]|nr:hypothetical protein [Peltigera leucophlebia]
MGFVSFFYRQLSDKPSPILSSISLAGQTAIVTGSNVGLGLEATRELIDHKISRVILAVRSLQKGEAAKTQLQTNHPDCDIQVWELDQDKFASINAFRKRAQTLDRLDIVILNAGVMKKKFVRSSSGHELNLQVNYLVTALLTLFLLPTLKITAKLTGQPSRLTIVTSEMHMWTSFKQRSAPSLFDLLDDEHSFTPEAYNVSKLLVVFWAYVGAPCTEMTTTFGSRMFKHLCAWTSAQVGHCLADAAVVKQAESHGGYLSEQKLNPSSEFVRTAEGQAFQTKLSAETIQLLWDVAPDADLSAY